MISLYVQNMNFKWTINGRVEIISSPVKFWPGSFMVARYRRVISASLGGSPVCAPRSSAGNRYDRLS
ncbi:hypothetical protein PILCRDRAFT_817695 [Piloderma croceum F 1598]|uniref:Uncharacterized protein n=1 Tax=Piloderma croceum (strain F 1598) TaxID=765440 RepID=A0A0C3FLG3_PILCF|nr:hypothetical protein PILCRDRAFT_817695 [Piloderma croceum F 1598]